MEYNFSKIQNRDGGVKIEDHEVFKNDYFLYLGSIIHKEKENRRGCHL